MTSTDGTIDLTDLVEKIKDTWIRWATKLIIASVTASPYFVWLKLPIISTLFEMFISLIVTRIASSAEMVAFFFNTSLRKASQADTYVKAAEALAALPKDVTDDEYERFELAEMSAFSNFVRITN